MTPVSTQVPPTKVWTSNFFTFPLCRLFAFSAAILWANVATGAVFHSRSEIADLAFPDCDRVETRDVFLSPEQRERIEHAAGSALDGALITIYEGYSGDRLVGYAMLDSHLVRTLSETLLVVLDASGAVAATYVMAFHEPPDYLPGDRWLGLFQDRRLSDDLRVGRAIVGITGATLSARAVVGSVRRSLAVYEILFAGP
jgi:hypothetical protein